VTSHLMARSFVYPAVVLNEFGRLRAVDRHQIAKRRRSGSHSLSSSKTAAPRLIMPSVRRELAAAIAQSDTERMLPVGRRLRYGRSQLCEVRLSSIAARLRDGRNFKARRSVDGVKNQVIIGQ
jgi:hypothetical protein